jgi:hypothetical protein
MSTLLERLKPSYKKIIDSKKDQFPTLVEGVMKHLSKIELVSDMKFGVWVDIKFFTNANSPYELFK